MFDDSDYVQRKFYSVIPSNSMLEGNNDKEITTIVLKIPTKICYSSSMNIYLVIWSIKSLLNANINGRTSTKSFSQFICVVIIQLNQ